MLVKHLPMYCMECLFPTSVLHQVTDYLSLSIRTITPQNLRKIQQYNFSSEIKHRCTPASSCGFRRTTVKWVRQLIYMSTGVRVDESFVWGFYLVSHHLVYKTKCQWKETAHSLFYFLLFVEIIYQTRSLYCIAVLGYEMY